jgi:transposase
MYERCTHSICNAHLQRELKYLNEELGITWAGSLRSILCQANEYKTNNNEVSLAYYQEVKEKIAHIIEEPLKIEESAFMTEAAIFKKRGKKKKSKALLYLQLFRDRLDEILRFLSDPKVPFDNNQAERDIRPVKLKQKISGSFRSIKGVNAFCIIRGYISTAKKQGEEIWNALLAAIRGTPLYLLANSS